MSAIYDFKNNEIPNILNWLRSKAKKSAIFNIDSRTIQPGEIFLSLGTKHDSADQLKHIKQAIAAKASAVLYEKTAFPVRNAIEICFPVHNLALHAGEIVSAWYNNPSSKLCVIGITGTNGKTSCALWIAQALEMAGQLCGLIGTPGWGLPQNLQFSGYTTPQANSLQQYYQYFLEHSANVVALEVSSHALDQGRVSGTEFTTAVFTNVTRDHLDYHGNMDAYQRAKQRLFTWPKLRYAVINADDPVGRLLIKSISNKVELITYGIQETAVAAIEHGHNWLFASNITIHVNGTSFLVTGQFLGHAFTTVIHSKMLGYFNVSNLLAVLATLLTRNIPIEKATTILKALDPPPGRMQKLEMVDTPLAIIDYAHTPDALRQVLATLKPIAIARKGCLWCVFGCGGDRDPGKRAQMGKIVEFGADRLVITSDNPRSENPAVIIQMIKSGLSYPEQATQIEDRASAILYALHQANKKDVVLIAGKGHETWQEINGIKTYFNDTQQANLALSNRKIGSNN